MKAAGSTRMPPDENAAASANIPPRSDAATKQPKSNVTAKIIAANMRPKPANLRELLKSAIGSSTTREITSRAPLATFRYGLAHREIVNSAKTASTSRAAATSRMPVAFRVPPSNFMRNSIAILAPACIRRYVNRRPPFSARHRASTESRRIGRCLTCSECRNWCQHPGSSDAHLSQSLFRDAEAVDARGNAGVNRNLE